MSMVRALIQIRAGEVGANPAPLNVALEEGHRDGVPSREFRDALIDTVQRAVVAAAAGGMAEVRVTVLPAGLPGLN